LAFLQLTTAKPIQILIVLLKAGKANIASDHFSLDRFDPPVRYADYKDDSNTVVWNAAGVCERRLPNADYTFEQQIHQLLYWEKRQHDTKQYIKQQHKEKSHRVTTGPPNGTCTIQNDPRILSRKTISYICLSTHSLAPIMYTR